MQEAITKKSHWMLFLNTLAFTLCFAVWMLNGVLITFLVENGIYKWTPVQMGWLIAIPVLTGAGLRLIFGIATDKFGGKWVSVGLLLICALSVFLLSYATEFWHFVLLGFGYGMAGNMFTVGIAYTSVWYPQHWQGRALGIFGAGNAGAALTTLFAPTLLKNFTQNGAYLEGWRKLPLIYAGALLVMAIFFAISATNKKPASSTKTIGQMLKPLKHIRVWRFGLYYFLVFGMFVAFSQWLVPYFVNMYAVTLVVAGFWASAFSLPSGVIRAVGGWLSDKFGARKVMYWVFLISIVGSLLLIFPKMQVLTPGKGVIAKIGGEVTEVTDNYIKVGDVKYKIKHKEGKLDKDEGAIFPRKEWWQEPVVKVGDKVKKKQLLAKGITKIRFDANIWIAGIIIVILGSVWGIGKAGVYKYIPDYFPEDVGSVGGLVGMLGGLGGFVGPVVFGYLLQWTGIWTSCWWFILALSLACFFALQSAVSSILKREAPHVKQDFEYKISTT